MQFLGILFIVFLLIALFGDRISRWFNGFMQRRAEDALRRMMGMPSRKEERKARKRAERESGKNFDSRADSRSRDSRRGSDGHIIPPEYAEDVEFTEFRDFSASTQSSGGTDVEYHESQVEEAEYVEIKTSGKK